MRYCSLLLLLFCSVSSTTAIAQCTASAGTVKICSPTAGASVPSPVSFSAAATAPSGQTISSMKLYIDGTGVKTVTGGSFSSSQTLSTGSHAITMKAWTNTGAVLEARESITVTSAQTCSPTASTVTICSPPSGATVDSPVAFQGVAGPPSGQTITGMKLYVDGVSSASSTTGSLTASVDVTAGTHAITMKAWTSGGTVLSAKESITVNGTSQGGGCTASASTVKICSPAAGASVDSPVTFQAVAAPPSGQQITGMKLYIDSVSQASSTGATLTSSQAMASGTHAITVKAWTSGGSVLSAKETITVNGSGGPPPSGGNGVFTYMYNNQRTGANTAESNLTVAAVTNGANFGKKGTWTVDGNMHTQPLYVPGVQINSGTFNVIYVATENDSVYALNADVPGQVLWKHNFLTSTATIGTGYTGGRTEIGANVGITGTPVIDPDTKRMYLVARTTENSNQVHRIHVLDITTGDEVMQNVKMTATVTGNGMGSNADGTLSFDSLTSNQRPALLLNNGILYIAFASFGDFDPYHGWLFAYDAGTLDKLAVYNNTPNSGGGGIWMSGSGPAADADGNIYLATGNVRPNATGLWDPLDNIPNSLVKVKLTGSTFSVVDYFSPYDVKCLSAKDLDLGSTGPVLIPDQFGGHNLVAVSSKEGRIYLLDRDNLGKWNSGSDSQILDSKLFNASGACESSTFNASASWRVYGTPPYWNGFIYLGSVFGPLRQYKVTNATLEQFALGTHTYQASGQTGRGPLAVVSANGNSNGIVWTAENDLNGDAWLRAYDATNVSKQLYSNKFGRGNSFMIPMVANGRVYIAAQKVLYVFGTLN